MEPKERAWSIAIVTVAVIAFAVRIQSSPADEAPQVVVQERAPSSADGAIPVSSGLPHTSRNTRFQVFAERGAPLARPYESEMDIPTASAPSEALTDNPDVLILAPEADETEPDVYIALADDYEVEDPWSMSDQEVVDQMLDILSPEQRADFRSMWAAMTASERRAWVNELRMAWAG